MKWVENDNMTAYCNECSGGLRKLADMRFINYENRKTSVVCLKCFETFKFDNEDKIERQDNIQKGKG